MKGNNKKTILQECSSVCTIEPWVVFWSYGNPCVWRQGKGLWQGWAEPSAFWQGGVTLPRQPPPCLPKDLQHPEPCGEKLTGTTCAFPGGAIPSCPPGAQNPVPPCHCCPHPPSSIVEAPTSPHCDLRAGAAHHAGRGAKQGRYERAPWGPAVL